MNYIVYVSTAKRLLSEEELLDLLMASRIKNDVINITGMLLYGEGTFMQVLEGEPDELDKLFGSIKEDSRHKNIITLITGVITDRNFPEWRMAFASVNAETLEEFKGFLNPAALGFLGNNNHATANMLRIFAQSNNLVN
jgi:hypothetical protein